MILKERWSPALSEKDITPRGELPRLFKGGRSILIIVDDVEPQWRLGRIGVLSLAQATYEIVLAVFALAINFENHDVISFHGVDLTRAAPLGGPSA